MEGVDIADLGAAREYHFLGDGVIRGVAHEQTREVDLRPEEVFRQPEIHGVVDSLVGIDRVVAAVQNPPD